MHFQLLQEDSQHSILAERTLLIVRTALDDSEVLRIAEIDVSEILALPQVDFVLLETHVYVEVYTHTQFN